MVYNDTAKRNEIYAEDIEEAIFQYLVKEGVIKPEDDYAFYFKDVDGKFVTTKCLLIKYVG